MPLFNYFPSGNFPCICCQLIFFSKSPVFEKKNLIRNAIRVSNSFDPDKAQHFVGPDLRPNGFQKLSTDNFVRFDSSLCPV